MAISRNGSMLVVARGGSWWLALPSFEGLEMWFCKNTFRVGGRLGGVWGVVGRRAASLAWHAPSPLLHLPHHLHHRVPAQIQGLRRTLDKMRRVSRMDRGRRIKTFRSRSSASKSTFPKAKAPRSLIGFTGPFSADRSRRSKCGCAMFATLHSGSAANPSPGGVHDKQDIHK